MKHAPLEHVSQNRGYSTYWILSYGTNVLFLFTTYCQCSELGIRGHQRNSSMILLLWYDWYLRKYKPMNWISIIPTVRKFVTIYMFVHDIYIVSFLRLLTPTHSQGHRVKKRLTRTVTWLLSVVTFHKWLRIFFIFFHRAYYRFPRGYRQLGH